MNFLWRLLSSSPIPAHTHQPALVHPSGSTGLFYLEDKFYHSMSKYTQYCQRSLPFEQLCILQGCLMQYPQPLQAVFCTTLLGVGAFL